MKSTDYYSTQRVGIFIDVQNLYHSAKNLYRARVNYQELIKNLVGDRQLIRAIAYVAKSEPAAAENPLHSPRPVSTRGEFSEAGPRSDANDSREERGERHVSSEASFFEALTKAGIELRMKDLQVFADGTKKGDWDVGMAVDAIRMASFLDVVILVTGDGDFVPLVDYLKWGLGRLVEVAAFHRSASGKLQEVADKFINMEDIPKVILRR